MPYLNKFTTTKVVPVLLALSAVTYFWCVSLYRISDMPGVFYDEARDIAPAIYACAGVSLNKNNTDIYYAGDGIFTDTWALPLTINNYRGLLDAYLILPALKIFGMKIAVIRFCSILFAFLAALSFTAALNNMFGPAPALLFLTLLLTNTCFIINSRIGTWGGQSLLWLTSALALFSLSLYDKTKKSLWLYAGAFFLGLGAYTHQILFFFIIGMIISWNIFINRLSILRFSKTHFICLVAFCLGFSPFLISNIFTGFKEIKHIFEMIDQSTVLHRGGGYSLFWDAIMTRNIQWMDIIGGSLCRLLPGINSNRYAIFILIAVFFLLFVPFLLFYRPIRTWFGEQMKYIYFLLSIGILYFISMFINLRGLLYTNLLNMLPLLFMIVAPIISAVIVYAKTKNKSFEAGIKSLVTLWFCLYFACQMLGFFNCFVYHERTGGDQLFCCSTAQNSLSKYLLDNNITRPIAVDWGISYPIMILTEGKVLPRDIFSNFQALHMAYIQDPHATFINVSNIQSKTFSRTLLSELRRINLKECNKRYFYDKIGTAVFYTFNLTE